MRYTLFIAVFTLFFVISPVQAESLAGKQLLEYCGSKDEKMVNRCAGYIQGLIDYHNLTTSLGTAPTVQFCIPKNVNLSQLVVIVHNYLNRNTQHDSFIASPAVALALFERFPCSTPKKKR